jgi:hypothetical protein
VVPKSEQNLNVGEITMKKIQSNVQRTGDHVRVTAAWQTRMRTPATVEIQTGKQQLASEGLLIEGEAADVRDTLAGLAELAWDMGWRPLGLDHVLGHVVRAYELPKPE